MWKRIKENYWVNEIKDLLVSVIIALIIVIPFRHFVAEPYIVQGASMSPNYTTGDYIIVNKFTSYLTKPDRGNVIVFVPPMERNKNTNIETGVSDRFFSGGWKDYAPLLDGRMKYIKRTIGLPGETVKLDAGRVYIKKVGSDKFEKLEEPYIKDHTWWSNQEVKLKDDEYFMLGDNRSNSRDSEEFGPIKYSDIIGRPFWRLFPFENFGFYPANYKFKEKNN